MIASSSRQKAIELTRNFVNTVSLATGKPIDFFMLLWVVHWAIESFGEEKTKQTLVDIMLDTNFAPENAAIMLRDRLFVNKIEEDKLGEWFKKAIG